MSVRDIVREALYNKYIKPTEKASKHVVGIELEYPIVNLGSPGGTGASPDAEDRTGAGSRYPVHGGITEPVDFDAVHELAGDFAAKFGFSDICRDDDGEIYNAVDPATGDAISFDCSYNTLEFSFGAAKDITEVEKSFRKYYTYIQSMLAKSGHTLTGMGINPGYNVNRIEPVATGRYRMLLRHLRSYVNYGNAIQFHDYPHFGLFSCASQVQLDAERGDLVHTLNTFTRLEPMKALLFANSRFDADEHHRFAASRDYLWRQSMHGVNPHNVDDYNTRLHSIDELISYIESMSMYCVERNGKYINFKPTLLDDYFSRESVTGQYWSSEDNELRDITFRPEISDLDYLRSFKFNDLTFRGTIEFRSVCEQPVRDVFSVAAFHAGLKRRTGELEELLMSDRGIYQQGYSVGELRRMFVLRDLPGFLDRDHAADLMIKILSLAEDGLLERGYGEEKYLAPLYRRAELLTNPAREEMRMLEEGSSIREILEDRSRIE